MQQLTPAWPWSPSQGAGSAWYFRQKPVDVAHFSAGPGFLLAVVMQERPGSAAICCQARISSPIRLIISAPGALSLRRAQRPARHGADVLLELRDEPAVHGPVAGVVNARRHLVDVEAVAAVLRDDEKLDGQDADIVESSANFWAVTMASAATSAASRAGATERCRM